jgi:hypothetical protein
LLDVDLISQGVQAINQTHGLPRFGFLIEVHPDQRNAGKELPSRLLPCGQRGTP